MKTNNSSQKSIIPVLTETVKEVLHDSSSQGTIPLVSKKDTVKPPPILSTIKNEAAWNELEERLTARILQQVQDRTQLILENSLQLGIKTILHHVAQSLVADIKNDLENTLEVVIAHAITEEMLRLQKLEHNLKDNNVSSKK